MAVFRRLERARLKRDPSLTSFFFESSVLGTIGFPPGDHIDMQYGIPANLKLSKFPEVETRIDSLIDQSAKCLLLNLT